MAGTKGKGKAKKVEEATNIGEEVATRQAKKKKAKSNEEVVATDDKVKGKGVSDARSTRGKRKTKEFDEEGAKEKAAGDKAAGKGKKKVPETVDEVNEDDAGNEDEEDTVDEVNEEEKEEEEAAGRKGKETAKEIEEATTAADVAEVDKEGKGKAVGEAATKRPKRKVTKSTAEEDRLVDDRKGDKREATVKKGKEKIIGEEAPKKKRIIARGYPSKYFHHALDEEIYFNKFQDRPLVKSRRFLIDEFADFPFAKWLYIHGFAPFAEVQCNIYPVLVRHFYSSWGHDGFTHVKGVEIEISPRLLEKVFGIPYDPQMYTGFDKTKRDVFFEVCKNPKVGAERVSST